MKKACLILILLLLSCTHFPPPPYGKPDVTTDMGNNKRCYSYGCYNDQYRMVVYYQFEGRWHKREHARDCTRLDKTIEKDYNCYILMID